MTDETRIEILKEVKRLIFNGEFSFICGALKWVVRDKGCGFKEVFKIFPELKKHKPKKVVLDHPWWHLTERGKKSRIEVLKSMIKEIKTKSND